MSPVRHLRVCWSIRTNQFGILLSHSQMRQNAGNMLGKYSSHVLRKSGFLTNVSICLKVFSGGQYTQYEISEILHSFNIMYIACGCIIDNPCKTLWT